MLLTLKFLSFGEKIFIENSENSTEEGTANVSTAPLRKKPAKCQCKYGDNCAKISKNVFLIIVR